MVHLIRLLEVTLLMGVALGHPAVHDEGTMSYKERRAFQAQVRRSLDSCSATLASEQTLRRAAIRRAEFFMTHSKRSLSRRDTPTILGTNHSVEVDPSVLGNPDDPNVSLFESSNACIITPEGEIGPFWVKGEHIRDDLVDDEKGVPVYLHAQFIDVNTCKPIPDLYADIWSANSTGVYSGVQSAINGNANDASNLRTATLRGIQKTNEDGIASFKTLFPGHYSGRCIHVHVVAHMNAEVLPNNTLTGSSVRHIGQMFFDQGLVDEVEKAAPYNSNKNPITTNARDRVANYETLTASDPFFHYARLGDSIEDGILAWVTIAVDTSQDYKAQCGAELGEDGGKMCSGGGGFGIPGGFPPGGPGGFNPPKGS